MAVRTRTRHGLIERHVEGMAVLKMKMDLTLKKSHMVRIKSYLHYCQWSVQYKMGSSTPLNGFKMKMSTASKIFSKILELRNVNKIETLCICKEKLYSKHLCSKGYVKI